MKEEITIDTNKSVGPHGEMYGHKLVLSIQETEDRDELPGHGPIITESLWVCLHCGYTCEDKRMLVHQDCNRKDNSINQTILEYMEKNAN